VLDVGQGLAVLVFSTHQTLLFDTGGKISADLSMFEAVVMPFLHSRGRHRIDTLIVSHGDEDHAFGVPDVLRRFPDIRLISSTAMANMKRMSEIRHERADHEVEPCQVGMQWQDGSTVFSLVHPALSDAGSENDLSCVLLIHHGASRVLLTGDIEASGEAQLVRRISSVLQRHAGAEKTPFSLDLMVAPHHGSNTSSTRNLLNTLHPQHIVFPAGQGNRYGFPHADVQSRYESAGAIPYITGTDGAVSFSFDRSGVDHPPSTWWRSHRSFWHGIVNTACSELFSEQSQALRLLSLAHKGQTLCGK
jgi:competence protein ComEC